MIWEDVPERAAVVLLERHMMQGHSVKNPGIQKLHDNAVIVFASIPFRCSFPFLRLRLCACVCSLIVFSWAPLTL